MKAPKINKCVCGGDAELHSESTFGRRTYATVECKVCGLMMIEEYYELGDGSKKLHRMKQTVVRRWNSIIILKNNTKGEVGLRAARLLG